MCSLDYKMYMQMFMKQSSFFEKKKVIRLVFEE